MKPLKVGFGEKLVVYNKQKKMLTSRLGDALDEGKEMQRAQKYVLERSFRMFADFD